MNWLAHFVLSPPEDGPRLGAWLADVLSRDEAASVVDAGVAAGMALHRRVDLLTDAHPAVLSARARLPDGVRRYAGIVLDVAWDHFLSVDFEALAGRGLEAFVAEVHAGLLRRRGGLRGEVAEVLDRMVRESWLTCYRDADGYQLTLERISNRLSPRARAGFRPEAARRHLESDRTALAADFQALWRDLASLAAAEGVRLPVPRT